MRPMRHGTTTSVWSSALQGLCHATLPPSTLRQRCRSFTGILDDGEPSNIKRGCGAVNLGIDIEHLPVMASGSPVVLNVGETFGVIFLAVGLSSM